MQRAGNYPLQPGSSDILGLECSGTVAALGEGVDRLGRGRPGLRALVRRRLRRILRRAGRAVHGRARRRGPHRCGRPPGDLLHRLGQCLRGFGAQAGRDLPGAGRLQRHRCDRHPARQGLGLHRAGDGGQRGEGRGLRGARRRPGHRLPRRGLRRGRAGRCGRRGRHPRHGGRRLYPAPARAAEPRRPALLRGVHARRRWRRWISASSSANT